MRSSCYPAIAVIDNVIISMGTANGMIVLLCYSPLLA